MCRLCNCKGPNFQHRYSLVSAEVRLEGSTVARKIKRQREGGKERDWKKMKNIKSPKCKGNKVKEMKSRSGNVARVATWKEHRVVPGGPVVQTSPSSTQGVVGELRAHVSPGQKAGT